VTDITEHPSTWIPAGVFDIFSRRVVGWSIEMAPTAALTHQCLGRPEKCAASQGSHGSNRPIADAVAKRAFVG
jgi:hypothetical protein